MDARADRHVEEILLRYDANEFDQQEAIAEMRKVMPNATARGCWSLLRPHPDRPLGDGPELDDPDEE